MTTKAGRATTWISETTMLLVLIAAAFVAGCGQKGDLVLPSPDAASAVQEAPTSDQDEEQDEADDE